MIEKEIKKRLNNVGFVELKGDTTVEGFKFLKEVPLPIMVDDIKKLAIEKNDIGVRADLISKGIIYVLGCDTEFKYKDNYKEILEAIIKDIKSFVISNTLKVEDSLDKYIYLNSFVGLGISDDEIEYNKLIYLENYLDEHRKNLKEEDQSEIIKNLLVNYEKIEDKKIIPYSNYRLGIINKAIGNYLKSKMYFEKSLESGDLVEDEELKNTLRREIEDISDYSNIEIAETYINYSDFDKAEEALKNVSIYYVDQSYLNFLRGFVYQSTGRIELAIEEYKKAISLNKNREDYYNSLAICLVNLNKYKEASYILEEGIENNNTSYNLKYNLGVIYVNLNKLEEARELLKEAYAIKPSEELYKYIESL